MSQDGVMAHITSQLFDRIWNDTEYDYKVRIYYIRFRLLGKMLYRQEKRKKWDVGHTIPQKCICWSLSIRIIFLKKKNVSFKTKLGQKF